MFTGRFFDSRPGECFWAEKGACYRCCIPNRRRRVSLPSWPRGAVLGVLPGIVGTIQANEVIKSHSRCRRDSPQPFAFVRCVEDDIPAVETAKDPLCPMCGEIRLSENSSDYEEFCGLNLPVEEPQIEEITAVELKALLDSNENIQLIDVREPFEFEIAKIPARASDPARRGCNTSLRDRSGQNQRSSTCKGRRSKARKAIEQLKSAGFAGPSDKPKRRHHVVANDHVIQTCRQKSKMNT